MTFASAMELHMVKPCSGVGSIDGWYFWSQLNSNSYDTMLNSVSNHLIIRWGSAPTQQSLCD